MAPRRRLRAWKVLLALLLTLGVAGFVAYYFATEKLAGDLVKPRNAGRDFDASVPDDVSRHLRVERGDVVLDTWVIEPRKERPPESVDWVLVLHGVSDQKRTMVGLGRRFANHGVGAILVDLRGHGLSSEVPITYGAEEVPDLSAVLDAVAAEGYSLGEVGVYGPSYGGAVGIQLGATDPRVTRAVSVASFASFRRNVRPHLEAHTKDWSWIIPGFFVDSMIRIASMRAGFDPDDASPEADIAHTNGRHLLVHSRDDEIVPYQQAVDMKDACGERCELLTLEGMDHLGSLSNQPLRERLHTFLTGEPLSSL